MSSFVVSQHGIIDDDDDDDFAECLSRMTQNSSRTKALIFSGISSYFSLIAIVSISLTSLKIQITFFFSFVLLLLNC